MKRSLSLAAGIVLVAALALAATSTAGAGSPITVKAVCTVGPIRCQSALRTDIPIVKQAQAAHDGFGPADLRAAYNIKSLALQRGQGQTVAIVDAYDDPTIESDLATYRSYYGLPPCTTANGCFRKVNQDGEQGNYPIANPDWNAEESARRRDGLRDLPQVPHHPRRGQLRRRGGGHVQPGAAERSRPGRGHRREPRRQRDLEQLRHRRPRAEPELLGSLLQPSGHRGRGQFRRLRLRHDLAGCLPVRDRGRRHDADQGVEPARLGGDRLGQPRRGLPGGRQGTGSGCSLWEPKPAWQNDTGCTGRTVADVAAVADPGTGVAVFDSSVLTGGWGVYGGTSVASPIIGGFYALAGNAKKITYGSYPYSHTKFLYDVTEGSNFTPNTACGYLCTAGPGYDGPTGLGTPNGIGAF